MNILVTGGAGFIGSHLCDRLHEDGHHLLVIDNLSLGRVENIQHLLDSDRFDFVQGDVLDESVLEPLFANVQIDVVFHMAANSDIAMSFEHPRVDMDNTFRTTYALLHAMKQHGVTKMVFASSSAIYGETQDLLHEDYGPLQPVSHYGAAKLASEAFVSSFAENYGMQAWIVRFPNVVGERATHGVIFDFINKLRANPSRLDVLGDGEQFKPYLYVGDLVDAMLFVWNETDEKRNVYNVGVTTRTRVREIAQMVIEEMKLDAEIVYGGGDRGWVGDVPEFNYDLSKVTELGWTASCTSNEAVRKSIQRILASDES